MSIDIQNCSGDDVSCLMAKGHHDTAEFMKAAKAYWDDSLRGWEGPMHVWWRWIPQPKGSDYKGFYHEAEPNSRGAFAATVIAAY